MKYLTRESYQLESWGCYNVLFILITMGREVVEGKNIEIFMAKFLVNLYKVTHFG